MPNSILPISSSASQAGSSAANAYPMNGDYGFSMRGSERGLGNMLRRLTKFRSMVSSGRDVFLVHCINYVVLGWSARRISVEYVDVISRWVTGLRELETDERRTLNLRFGN